MPDKVEEQTNAILNLFYGDYDIVIFQGISTCSLIDGQVLITIVALVAKLEE